MIGLEVKVAKSSSTYEGITGIVVWETRNTFHILSKEKTSVVPKKGNSFEFNVHGKHVLLEGETLERDPVERTKKGLIV
jgi:RNase P/RNase MRP subunit p29